MGVTDEPTPHRDRTERLGDRLVQWFLARGRTDHAVRASRFPVVTVFTSDFAKANALYRAARYDEAYPLMRRAVLAGLRPQEAQSRLATTAIRTENVDVMLDAALVLASVPHPPLARLDALAEAIEKTGSDQHSRDVFDLLAGLGGSRYLADRALRTEPPGTPRWKRLELLLAAERWHRDDADWLLDLARTLEEQRRFSEAAERYDRFLELTPTARWQYYRAARAHERAGHHTRAAQLYARAIERDHRYQATVWGVGALHEAAGAWHEAAREYTQQLGQTRDSHQRGELFWRLGASEEALGHYERAAQSYGAAADLAPHEARKRFRQGIALELAGDIEAALRCYTQALALEGHERDQIRFRIGFVHWRAGRTAAALPHLLSFASRGRAEGIMPPSEPLAVPHPRPSVRLGKEGNLTWAAMSREANDFAAAAQHLRQAFLEGGLTRAQLADWADSLVRAGETEEAARVIVEWRTDPNPRPLRLTLPQRDRLAMRNARYATFRKTLAIRPDVILYESSLGRTIDCNPLAVCRWLLRHRPGEFLHVWAVDGEVAVPADIDASPDIVLVQRDSDEYLRALASAAYLVNNSTFATYPFLRDEQRYLNTWHGTPLKAMGKDAHALFDYANIARNFLQATALIHPNQHTVEKILHGVNVDDVARARVEITGYPRNDALVRARTRRRDPGEQRTVLIAPSWRPQDNLAAEAAKITTLAAALSSAGFRALVRAHHYVERDLLDLGLEGEIVARTIPTNDLLLDVDVLVTDYSSIFFDFAITRRPIVFFVPDWEEYRTERGLYLDQSELPGTVCTTPQQVVAAVISGETFPDMDRFLARWAPGDDGRASERAAEMLLYGPTFGQLAARTSAAPAVLLHGSLLQNGISSALAALANRVAGEGITTAVITSAEEVRSDPSRLLALERLDDPVHLLARVGPFCDTPLQLHARAVERTAGAQQMSASLRAELGRSYDDEVRRTLGTSRWNVAVEYEGYSMLWAELMLGLGRTGSRTAIYLHNDIDAEARRKFPWIRDVAGTYRQFDRAIAVSSELALLNAEKLSASDVAVGRIEAARNLVDTARILRLAAAPVPRDIEEFIGESDRLVLAVGRLSPEKNLGFLVEVFAAVAEALPDARLVICGEGPDRAVLQSLITDLGLTEHVLLAGQRQNVYSLMRRSQLLALPSLHEGQPVVLLEAATLARPAVASEIRAIDACAEMGVHQLTLERNRWVDTIRDHLTGASPVAAMHLDQERYLPQALAEFFNAVGLDRSGVVA